MYIYPYKIVLRKSMLTFSALSWLGELQKISSAPPPVQLQPDDNNHYDYHDNNDDDRLNMIMLWTKCQS